jgi:glycosyltransferase involved in cell wall biosynthesis
MDGDLQNDPADIPLLVNRLAEGYDMVLGERVARKDNFLIRKLPSRVANWLIRRVTGVPFRDFGCTLRAMRREVALALPLYGEMHRFITAMAIQQGARVTQVPVRHHPRIAGKTKYGLSRSVRVILDLMTVQFLYRYQARPMHLFGLIGLLLIAAGCVSLAVTWLMKQYSHMNMTGNPFLLLSVMLALMGTQSLALGLMGEMLARTYFESQDKPAYSVRETRNLDWRRPRRRRRRKNRVSKPTLDAGEIRG